MGEVTRALSSSSESIEASPPVGVVTVVSLAEVDSSNGSSSIGTSLSLLLLEVDVPCLSLPCSILLRRLSRRSADRRRRSSSPRRKLSSSD